MTRDDILRLVEESGFDLNMFSPTGRDFFERFAELVAAEEREACAKVCDALVADGMRGTPEWNSGVLNCVAAIRARGEK